METRKSGGQFSRYDTKTRIACIRQANVLTRNVKLKTHLTACQTVKIKLAFFPKGCVMARTSCKHGRRVVPYLPVQSASKVHGVQP